MQLLWKIVTCLLKSVEHEIEHDIDSAYGVCMHYTFLNFIADLINTLQFKQMMSLTVCNIMRFSFTASGETDFLLSLDGYRILWSIGIK